MRADIHDGQEHNRSMQGPDTEAQDHPPFVQIQLATQGRSIQRRQFGSERYHWIASCSSSTTRINTLTPTAIKKTREKAQPPARSARRPPWIRFESTDARDRIRCSNASCGSGFENRDP